MREYLAATLKSALVVVIVWFTLVGVGAWQVAVRFSSVDLNDGDISGGDAENISLGLNWYATNNIRMSANYVNVLDVNGGTADGDEPEAFQMRAQVEF